MRTDYKIGIAVVLFVVGVVVLYNTLSDGSSPQNDQKKEPASTDARLTASALSTEGFYSQPRWKDEEIIPGRGASVVGGDNRGDNTSEESSTHEGSDSPADTSGGDNASSGQTDGMLARAGKNSGSGSETAAPPGSGESREATSTGWPSGPDSYIVREGDAGFWAVAQNAYGHGKYWHLVAQANPSADSNALRAGQKLKIPQLPRPSARSGRGRDTALAGRIVTEESGVSYYYVKPGDAGFWAVSEQAYGDGKHWALIKDANPQANSGRLRTGQKLTIPPLSTTGALPRAAGTAAASGAPALLSGEEWYTVQEGDNGFWGVAEKKYGSGEHWKLIADANPSVSARRLRPGLRLRIPPRPSQPTATAGAERHGDASRFE